MKYYKNFEERTDTRINLFLAVSIFLVQITWFSSVFGQQNNEVIIHSEAPIVFENDVRMSNLITVKFKNKIFDLPIGVKTAGITDMASSFSNVISYFSHLQNRYGAFLFRKQIPSAKWGDVWRKHRRTGELVQIPDMSQLFYVRFSQFVPIDSIIAELEAMDEVLYAHGPIQTVSFTEPDDPCFSDISNCVSDTTGVQWNLEKIEAQKVWDITHGSSEIIIGIIEDGMAPGTGFVDRNHQDFILPSGESKFVPNLGDFGAGAEHATQVAGVVGAATDDSEGIASLGWNINMIPYRFTRYDDDPDLGLVSKIDSATANADVINCSFVTMNQNIATQIGDCKIFEAWNYPSVREAIDNAITRGVVVVAGTGNTGIERTNQAPDCFDPDVQNTLVPYTAYPAAYPGVIGVSASDINDVWAGGRNYNYGLEPSFTDFVAPAIDILTTNPNDNYAIVSGTSFASPLVAALAGLILSINDLPPDEVEQIIENTAIDIGEPAPKQGAGRINAYEALKYTLENYGGTLTRNVTIPAGETPTLEPGVTLKFASGVKLTINGSIQANGTASDPITFTSAEASPAAGDWSGIWVQNASASSSFDCCVVEYSANGIRLESTSGGVTVAHSTLRQNTVGFISQYFSPVTLDSSEIHDNGGLGCWFKSNASAHSFVGASPSRQRRLSRSQICNSKKL